MIKKIFFTFYILIFCASFQNVARAQAQDPLNAPLPQAPFSPGVPGGLQNPAGLPRTTMPPVSSRPQPPGPGNTNIVEKPAKGDERPNGKRIRRHLNLVVGITHDEELRIPDVPLTILGRTQMISLSRIEGTDYFRIFPVSEGNGIVTLLNKKTGQVLVELRFVIRDDSVERMMREVQAMLSDIEGIEFKIVNGVILLDGYVLIPRDLMRIGQVLTMWPPDKVKSLVTLSPIARKKIVEFISNDVNNPEVKISALGDYIKLEGQVNNLAEKERIMRIVSLYMPDVVVEKAPDPNGMITIRGRKNDGRIEDLIVDLITIKTSEEKVEPPPKMIQVVAHFVKFSDSYLRSFNFSFAPVFSARAGTNQQPPTTTIDSTIQLLNNLLPKLNWAKTHGYAKILDTASILVQDRVPGSIDRNVASTVLVAGQNGALQADPSQQARVALSVTPSIKSERSGLVELRNLNVTVSSPAQSEATTTAVNTTISVRDRQSAAFGGILKKDSDTNFGNPLKPDAIITLEASKSYARKNSQFVVFVTPIIKSSASAGVEQVKKKFRLRD